MPRKKSPWPKGLKIDPENNPLAELPDEHPAKQVLIARAICQRDCAAKEIEWPDGPLAITQPWYSETLGREFTFASFIYEYVCIDLVLNEWLERPPVMTSLERESLAEIPDLKALLAECRSAATTEQNLPILDLLPKAEAFVTAWEASIRARLLADHIPVE